MKMTWGEPVFSRRFSLTTFQNLRLPACCKQVSGRFLKLICFDQENRQVALFNLLFITAQQFLVFFGKKCIRSAVE